MDNGDAYLTKDLYEAAFLITHNLKLLRLVKEDNYYWFVFGNKTKAEELSAQFWRKEIDVNAKIFAENIRSLKDRIFARKG